MMTVTQIWLFLVYGRLVEPLGICSPEKGEDKCCTNYRLIGNNCTPCVGSYGIHCSHACPPGYCGQQCRTTCQCAVCDSHNCTCRKGTTLSYEDPISANPSSQIILFAIIIIPVVGVSLTILICWIFIRRNPSCTKRRRTLHKKIQPAVEEGTAQDDVSYAAIRESQMCLDVKSNANTLKNIQHSRPPDNIYDASSH
ncbi:multiple epidermal growth factor-like domains protein 10 isoform X2 [Ostrea edulis]|uniref:multiple epidermal growth factor-like domains protein 10 isoform X2 n=1 Tax=Ostrea edulis TaxID=37623 RepID=UPI002095EE57|nr:multiple epidermal growth factor-like domains protein 10 isoform X2 [Ostrea edulis]